MNLYNDLNKNTTVKGLGFRNREVALDSIDIVEDYFDKLYKKQKIPGYSSSKTLPRKYIKTKKESKDYYDTQKMYRILGLHNRAKSMIERIKNKESIKNIKEAIKVFKSYYN